jgi:outer membrane protein assembly factor BamB
MTTSLSRFSLVLFLAMTAVPLSSAGDWPMWRYDARRSGASPDELPAQLFLRWSRDYAPEVPAWPDQEKMPFDICYEPIVVGQTVYINSSRHDCIRALDAATGDRKWIFFADGPIRFAPLHHKGKLYFTSDDGYLYCLNAESGEMHWRVRGGPSDRRILGNQRLISTWPARGAPVVTDDAVYFAASIWPFMGVFIHAVDPDTGRILWTNDGDGSTYMKQPHATDAFASVAPQGPLAIENDHLILPGGRSIPAVFNRKTGKLLRLPLAENGKLGGGSEAIALGDIYFNGGAVFETVSSKYQGAFAKLVIATPSVVFGYENGYLRAFDPTNYKLYPHKETKPGEADPAKKDTKSTPAPKITRWQIEPMASAQVPALEVMIMAGSRIYGGGENFLVAIDWDDSTKSFHTAWKLRVEGTVCRLVAGADCLFAATRGGTLMCLGATPTDEPRHFPLRTAVLPPEAITFTKQAEALLDVGGVGEGYAVHVGYGEGGVVSELVRLSKLNVIALEPNADKVLAGRRTHIVSDLYGSRIAILSGDPRGAQLPPYFASVIYATKLKAVGLTVDDAFLRQAFHSLRPFGGRLILSSSEVPSVETLRMWAKDVPQAKVTQIGDFVVLSREGPLPGSANWTNEHADASNTRVGKDTLVKAPMGLLWFGGPSHDGVLPRHGHGPQPQVIDGRIIIEGVDMIRALDIYTGRLLWETPLPGVGTFFNNLAHQAGANASGGNFVSASDGIYVAWDRECAVLDPDTGKIKHRFKLPPSNGSIVDPIWGYINVEGDYLIGGADPIYDENNMPPRTVVPGFGDDDSAGKPVQSKSLAKLVKAINAFSDNMSASRRLVVMDRHTGKVLWQTEANYKFRHNGTCVGGGRLFTIDRMGHDEKAKKKDDPLKNPYRILAFDLATGEKKWEAIADVFGTWLSYSVKHDVLVEAGRWARDTLKDEPRGVAALDAKTGKTLWSQSTYTGPAMIHGDEILLESGACDILTGGLKLRNDPITGDPVPWKWTRTYGCNTPAASEHLLTFRSGAAGYFDLCNDGGTGNFGGFRSSCTNNLIVAGGLLTVPEYTRTCTCNYQNQTSVAIMHMPDAEMWTYFGTKEVKGAVKRLGVNLGAVGDRKADNGTLWLEYPSTGGVSPAVGISFKPNNPQTYRRFSGNFTGPLNWVGSSGLKGATEIAVPLGKVEGKKSRSFTVRMIFAEPDDVLVDARKFHVQIQGKRLLTNFDITREAGGPRRTIVREFQGIGATGETLTVQTIPASGTILPPVLSGFEIVEEHGR